MNVASPLATASNACGISLFINEDGEKRILLTDYELCGTNNIKDVFVNLNFSAQKIEIVGHNDCKAELNLIKKQEEIKGFTVKIRPGESMILSVE